VAAALLSCLWVPACSGAQTVLGEAGETETAETESEILERNLCDGSQDLRLAWLRARGGSINAELEREIGFYYLYVRGDCRYWVLPYQKPPEIEVFETRTGTLDAEAEAALAALVSYGEWDPLVGVWPEYDAFDITVTFVHDGTDVIICEGNCPGAPEAVLSLDQAANTAYRELWESGEPLVDEPMRVLANLLEPGFQPGQDVEIVPWTVDLDLATVAVSYEELVEAGMSTLIDDPALTVALREFRAQHAKLAAQFFGLVVETQSGELYELFLRDALPLENDQGLIPTPAPKG
jgi:hypothetical protein